MTDKVLMCQSDLDGARSVNRVDRQTRYQEISDMMRNKQQELSMTINDVSGDKTNKS